MTEIKEDEIVCEIQSIMASDDEKIGADSSGGVR